MAISASAVWEVRTTGDDTNGGGFVATGTDRSQQDAAQVVIDGVAIICTSPAANSNTLTFVSGYTPSAADVGNIVNIASGTNINAGFYQITAQNSTTWTLTGAQNLTTAGGAGITIVGKMGGAVASPAKIGLAAVASNAIYIKSGAYSITSASTNISNGCFSSAAQLWIEGYTSTRGDYTSGGAKPVFTASGGISTFTVFSLTATRSMIRFVEVDCAGLTSGRGFSFRGIAYFCKCSNATNSAFVPSTSGYFIRCEATGCSSVAAFLLNVGGTIAIDCVSHDNTAVAFSSTTASLGFVRCVAYNNSGATTDGFIASSVETKFINCISYGNGRDGFRIGDSVTILENCIAEGNTGVGLNINGGVNQQLLNCAAFNNTGGNTSVAFARVSNDGFVTGTASFFVDPANGNFALNNTVGGGAVARYAGFPGVNVNSTGYVDIGTFQHKGDTSTFGFSG